MKSPDDANRFTVERPFSLPPFIAVALSCALMGHSSAQPADPWAQWDQSSAATWANSLVSGHNTLVALSGDVLTSVDGNSWTRTLSLSSAGLMASGEGLLPSPHLFFAKRLFILT